MIPSSDFGATVLGSKAAADADAEADASAEAAVVGAAALAAADGAVDPPELVHAEAAMTAAPNSANSRVDLFMVSSKQSRGTARTVPPTERRPPRLFSEGRYYRIADRARRKRTRRLRRPASDFPPRLKSWRGLMLDLRPSARPTFLM